MSRSFPITIIVMLLVVPLLVVGGFVGFSSLRKPVGPRRSAPPGSLREVGKASGLTIQNVCGAPREKRFIIESMGCGAALLDYDLDGDLDIYIVNGSSIPILRGTQEPVRNALYRNDGDWRFTDVTEVAGVGDTGWGCGCAVGDIDRDGDPDLYVTNFGSNVLYENLGEGRFAEMAGSRGVADTSWGTSAAFGDTDGDGDLDLYVANFVAFDIDHPPNEGRLCQYKRYKHVGVMCGPVGLEPQPDLLYRNDGTGHFEDFSAPSGVREAAPRYGLGVVFGDYDGDGRVDIYVANDATPNFLFHNLGGGRFEEVAGIAGAARRDEGTPQAGMGVDFGDIDGDGKIDAVVTNFSDDYNTIYRNLGEGFFQDLTHLHGLARSTWPFLAWGTKFFDADNDGDLDLYIANGHVYPQVDGAGIEMTYRQPDQMFLNPGGGKFEEAKDRILLLGPPRSSRGAAFGDIDNDGDIDVVVVEMADRPTLLENVGGGRGRWIRITLRGRESNTEGAGARVRLTSEGRSQLREATRGGSFGSSNDPRVHFGLGDADRVERIEILWPSGKTQAFTDLPVDRDLIVDEEKGIVEGI